MPKIASRIVEICVFRFRRDKPEYLLLKRSPEEDLYPGLWQLVTGTMHDGERAADTALRELKEETGLQPVLFWVVPFVNTFYDHEYDAVNLSPMFAAQVDAVSEPVLSNEHRAYAWVGHAEARERLVWPGQRQGLDVAHEYIVGGKQAGTLAMISM